MVAIGFDLGETLLTYAGTPLSWVALYPAALARAAERCGATPDAGKLEAAGQILARHNTRLHPRRQEIGAEIIFTEILQGWELAPEPHLTAAMEGFFGFFQQRMQPYPETAEVLAQLRAAGRRTGVLTDVPYGMPRTFVARDLDGAGLSPLVDIVLTSVEVGWRKPEPAGFQTLARQLNAAPDRLWYVGNEEKDIVGANAAGATAILIDREARNPQWGQRYTLRDLRELIPLLEKSPAR